MTETYSGSLIVTVGDFFFETNCVKIVGILLVHTHTHTYTVLVAEVTQPSLGVGYEIGRAVTMEKNILCLYRPQVQSEKRKYCIYTHYIAGYIFTFDRLP